MSETAAVFSVGNTAGGCEFAVQWILRNTSDKPDLYYFFGLAARSQELSPSSTLNRLRSNPEFAGLKVEGEQATDAFSLDKAHSAALELVRRIEERGYKRIYVGITGATNPMVAGLFHAAMQELSGQVVPLYVQSRPGPSGEQMSIEVISGKFTRESILMEKVLGLARRSHLSAACALAADLPASGAGGHVRAAIDALARWDNFEYSTAAELTALAQREAAFSDQPLLGPLNDTVRRYSSIGRHFTAMEEVIADPERFAGAREQKGWKEKVRNLAIGLPVDALENGWRRAAEGRGSDAVLRAYRAVEIAVQCRLFAEGVHPSALDWTRAPLAALANEWSGDDSSPPSVVSFEQAVHLASAICAEDFADTLPLRRDLQLARNNSYLEHGYKRIAGDSARKSLEKAASLVSRFLWNLDVQDWRRRLAMRF